MFTAGLGGIGAIYDFFTLSGQVRAANFRNALFEGHRHVNLNSDEQDNWRYASDALHRVVNNKNQKKDHPERIILKIAKNNKGLLTVSDVALGANVSIAEAQKQLDTLVSKGYAELRVRKSGSLVYVIPDLADKDEPLEDI